MSRLPVFAALLLASACLDTSTAPTIDAIAIGAPPPWGYSTGQDNYQVGLAAGRSEATSLFIRSSGGSSYFASVAQSLRAEAYRGKRIRLSAWTKHEDLAATHGGLWMRVDGPTGAPSFDNMSDRPLAGTPDWHQISVVLDVPEDAIGIAIGVLMDGGGLVQFDDLTFEVVGLDVPVTRPLREITPDPNYGAQLAPHYATAPDAPLNLGFEIGATSPSAAISWLKDHSVELTSTDPTAALDDLAALTDMVGNAHVVGLGEGTHGTREFFTLKHRIVKHLVTQMGFTHFAIEAAAIEADDVNRYVLGGPGDATSLLSRLYIWPWRTQEVLDLIEWMRAYNATVPAAQRVQFLGVDIQYPAAAMDSVNAFIQRVDAAQSSYVTTRFECIVPFRNNLRTPGQSWSSYLQRSAPDRTACAAGLEEVYDLIETNRTAYTTAEPARFEGALHAARLVQQFEAMLAAGQNILSSNYARDKAMAENAVWIRQQAGPDAKIVIWAHNDHVNATANWMGGHLRTAWGSDYRTVGFLFGNGSFNAVSGGDIRPSSANGHPTGVLERYFVGVDKPLILFDARQIPSGGAVSLPLAGPIRMRSVGSTYEGNSALYYRTVTLPGYFDLLLFVNTTTASTLLPYTP